MILWEPIEDNEEQLTSRFKAHGGFQEQVKSNRKPKVCE